MNVVAQLEYEDTYNNFAVHALTITPRGHLQVFLATASHESSFMRDLLWNLTQYEVDNSTNIGQSNTLHEKLDRFFRIIANHYIEISVPYVI